MSGEARVAVLEKLIRAITVVLVVGGIGALGVMKNNETASGHQDVQLQRRPPEVSFTEHVHEQYVRIKQIPPGERNEGQRRMVFNYEHCYDNLRQIRERGEELDGSSLADLRRCEELVTRYDREVPPDFM